MMTLEKIYHLHAAIRRGSDEGKLGNGDVCNEGVVEEEGVV